MAEPVGLAVPGGSGGAKPPMRGRDWSAEGLAALLADFKVQADPRGPRGEKTRPGGG